MEEKELISICCGYQPYGEVDNDNLGRCARCKEGTLFESI